MIKMNLPDYIKSVKRANTNHEIQNPLGVFVQIKFISIYPNYIKGVFTQKNPPAK